MFKIHKIIDYYDLYEVYIYLNKSELKLSGLKYGNHGFRVDIDRNNINNIVNISVASFTDDILNKEFIDRYLTEDMNFHPHVEKEFFKIFNQEVLDKTLEKQESKKIAVKKYNAKKAVTRNINKALSYLQTAGLSYEEFQKIVDETVGNHMIGKIL